MKDKIKISEIKCKTALSKSQLPGLDYSLNPYRGCQHSCIYCYVPNILRIKRDQWGTFIDIKTNIPIILSKELKNKNRGTVGISTVTDSYQPVEKKYRLTRYCLEQLLIKNFPISIQTKSNLILRDIYLITKFKKKEVLISIGTINEQQKKVFEPNTPTIKKRLETIKKLTDNNIKTTIFFGPIYPSIKVSEIAEIINTFKNTGTKDIMIDKLNLKPGIVQKMK